MGETAIAGLDHSIIGVRDLEAARSAYERLGFTVTGRGRHRGWGTANYCIMFGPDYLELLGIIDPEQFNAGLEDFLKEREGLMRIACRSDDIEATRAHLQADGFNPGELQDLGRFLEMPEGDVVPRFKLSHLPAADTPGLATFFCQHLTPEMVWRPEWMTHANGAQAVYAYTILHQNPAALAACYERFFGITPVVQDSRIIVETGGGKLVFCRPEDLQQLHPGLIWSGPEDDGTMIAATISVAETDRTASVLDQNGVSYARGADGALLVAPADACGMAIRFQAIYR